jgi:hypothetical protein
MKIGPVELILFLAVTALILFLTFKAAQWYSQSKKNKKD